MPDPAPSTPATDPAEVSDQSTPPPSQDLAPPAPAGQGVEQQATAPAPEAGPPTDSVAATEAAPAAVTDRVPAATTEAAPAADAGSPPAPPVPGPAPAATSTPPVAPADTSTPTAAPPPPPVSGDVDPGDEHGDGDGEGPESAQDEPGGRRDRKKVQIDARVLLALLVVAALAAGAYAFGTYQGNQAKAPQTTGTTVFQPPKAFTTLTDPETGVKLSVPSNWAQYSTKELKDKAIRLIVGIPNTGDTVVVRVNSYSTEITEANLADQKNVFDQLLGAEDIEIFVNEMTKLNGMPALFYVYRFTDAATGTTGIHAHYFVFQGRKMVSLIFQALPEPRYETLAPTLDRIANSLEVAPGPPPAFLEPAVTTTVAPGATPAPGASPAPGAAPAPAPPTTG